MVTLIDIYEELNRSPKRQKLDEVTRKNLVGKTKYQSKARYLKRKNYTVDSRYSIDVQKFINDDMIAITAHVGDYECTVAFEGVLENLIDIVQHRFHNNLTLADVYKALYKCVDTGDIYVNCTCKDYCLHEDTNIKLLNGEVCTIKEMKSKFDNGEEMYVYSTDANGDFKPGKVNSIWVSGQSSDMIKITLDNGKEIITTPNHKYMLRNGEYEEAQNLEIGTSLMPLYFSYHNGYESVMSNSNKKSFQSVYKIVANELLQDLIEEAKVRSNEDSIAIHHSDFNKLNNYPSNLKPMGVQEHYLWHSHHVTDNPEHMKKFIEAGHQYWITEEGRKQKSEEMSINIKKFWDGMNEEERSEFIKSHITDETCQRVSDALKDVWASYTEEEYDNRCAIAKEVNNRPEKVEASRVGQQNAWNSYSPEEREKRSKISAENLSHRTDYSHTKEQNEKIGLGQYNYMKSLSPEELIERNKNFQSKEAKLKSLRTKARQVFSYIVENNLNLNQEEYEKVRKQIQGNHKYYPKFHTIFNSIEEAKEYYGLDTYNHLITNIEWLHYEEPIPVYDMEVDEYNNFYVDAGVVLHNCYRYKYWATRLGYQYGAGERRPAHITNPRNNIGSFCKHLTRLLADKSWLKKCSSVVNVIIKDNIEDVREHFGLEEDELVVNDSRMNLKQYQKKPKVDDTKEEPTVEVEPEKEPEETENEPEENNGGEEENGEEEIPEDDVKPWTPVTN